MVGSHGQVRLLHTVKYTVKYGYSGLAYTVKYGYSAAHASPRPPPPRRPDSAPPSPDPCIVCVRVTNPGGLGLCSDLHLAMKGYTSTYKGLLVRKAYTSTYKGLPVIKGYTSTYKELDTSSIHGKFGPPPRQGAAQTPRLHRKVSVQWHCNPYRSLL